MTIRRPGPSWFATAIVALFVLKIAAVVDAAEVAVSQHAEGVKVTVDGQPFAEYLIRSGAKPIVWPIVGPTGQEMTRAFPMRDVEGEKRDHVHQRSLWFTHGEVNGIDFWAETASYGTKPPPADKKFGYINHRSFDKVQASGNRAEIVTTNDWVDAQGKKQCEDTRRLVFHVLPNGRAIDFDITLRATAGDVEFGDTKEGCLGVRIPTALDVKGGTGTIVTSEGLKNTEAWGKRARWVDYYGKLNDQVVGIAMFNHPSSYGHPAYWHVRDYGLFASNPFGIKDFEPKSGKTGKYVIESGKSLSMRHRILFHAGDTDAAKIAEAYATYAASP